MPEERTDNTAARDRSCVCVCVLARTYLCMRVQLYAHTYKSHRQTRARASSSPMRPWWCRVASASTLTCAACGCGCVGANDRQ